MNCPFRILFVDDKKSNIFHTESIIELDKLPVIAMFAKNPVEALEYLRKLSPDSFPDCIISDIHMPFLDGFEFADQYETEFRPHYPKTKFFIASSSHQPGDMERVTRHKCIACFLEKPVSKSVFANQVFPLLHQHTGLKNEKNYSKKTQSPVFPAKRH